MQTAAMARAGVWAARGHCDVNRAADGDDSAFTRIGFEGVHEMKRRQFLVLLVGTGLWATQTAHAADPIVVYKDAG